MVTFIPCGLPSAAQAYQGIVLLQYAGSHRIPAAGCAHNPSAFVATVSTQSEEATPLITPSEISSPENLHVFYLLYCSSAGSLSIGSRSLHWRAALASSFLSISIFSSRHFLWILWHQDIRVISGLGEVKCSNVEAQTIVPIFSRSVRSLWPCADA